MSSSSSRAVDEGFAEKERKNSSTANEHRFILFTFNELEQLQLRHTWKDSYSILQEELKNISYESRLNNNREESETVNSTEFIEGILKKFEEFMDKFEASYFNCNHLTGGNFILKESENVFIFCLSNQKSRLQVFNEKLHYGWQRKNILIQLHPDSYKEFCESNNFPYFPVTNLRDSDQLARSLCHANIFNSFETPNMELLGKGGIAEFVIDQKFGLEDISNSSSIGLIKPNYFGKPKWPIPTTLTESSWSERKPKLFIQRTFDPELVPKIQFDEYLTYCPSVYKNLKEEYTCTMFNVSVQCDLGTIPIGFGEIIEDSSTNINNVPLFKLFIGPFNFKTLTSVMYDFEPFSKYLQNIPQFYEYYLHASLGEYKWNELCKQSGGKSWRNEFPLPNGLVDSKNYFKTSWRQKCKNDLALLVERSENSHRLRTGKRQSSYHPNVFPSLSQLKKDSGHLNRLLFRFKNCLQVFLASSDPQMGCSSEFNQFQLSQVLFKHCLSVHQMTDFSEMMQKKRSLRPLFNENERDLFHILKTMPCLEEEMSSVQFVCGDIFGNPYKKERKTREPSKMAKKRANLDFYHQEQQHQELGSIEEFSDEESSSNYNEEARMLSPISIDEIDFKELESENISNGTLESQSTAFYDLSIVQKWIKSPGGLEAMRKLIETLPIIENLDDLNCLLNWSKRFKRIKMTRMISERIFAVNKC